MNPENGTMTSTEFAQCAQRLSQAEVLLNLTRVAMFGEMSTHDEHAKAQRIKLIVCKCFGVPIDQMDGVGRPDWIAWPRQIAMALCRQCTTLSLQEIGTLFGKRDHGTVIHAERRVKQRSDTEPKTALLIATLKDQFTKQTDCAKV